MLAARTVGPATRPLQLYYALAQAGLAITTASLERDSRPAHGLAVTPGATLLETVVSPKGDGMFQAVAEATGSAALTAPAQLGDVWASIPDLVDTIDEERWPVAIPAVEPRDDPLWALKTQLGLVLILKIGPVPQSADDATRHLRKYPTAKTGEVLSPSGGWFGLLGVPVRWSREVPFSLPELLDEVAPEYRFRDERWVRPSVGPNDDYLSPLMAWWVLLYALSMLSRYHAAHWATALDIDTSPVAAEIEFALNVALEAVPHLVLEGIYNDPVLLPRADT